ncbi:MAG TPA: hypothetical protein VG890_03010 [Puia sp.]|nr:hypothetical protein [Puia sp.]
MKKTRSLPFHSLSAPGCVDTSQHLLTSENGSWLGLDYITKTRDGNILVAGFRATQSAPNYTSPYLVKYTPQGNILWSKSFDGPGIYPLNFATAYKCFELNDGSLLLAGSVDVPELWNGRSELALWKLDGSGNLQWAQTDSCSIWIQYSGDLFVKDCVQDAAGNIYLGGNQYAFDAISTGAFVLKMDPAGNIQWDKSFASRAGVCFGIMFAGNGLNVIGSNADMTVPDGGWNTTNYLWCIRVNLVTGDSLWAKAWYPDFGSDAGWNAITNVGSALLLDNGHIGVFGKTLSDLRPASPRIHAAIAEFDTDFNYLRGWMIGSDIQSNFSGMVVTEQTTGRISYSYMTELNSYDEDIAYGAIENGQIIRERVFHERNRSNGWTSNFLFFPGNEDIVFQMYSDPVANTSGQEMIRLHDSDTSSLCGGSDTTLSMVLPYAMKRLPNYSWDSIAATHSGEPIA